MFEIDRNLQLVIVIFIGILMILYKKKPSIMFHNDGSVKQFGTGPKKTITPTWLVSLSITLLIYLQLTVKDGDFV
tara:strand:- start:206 stop:430 length:225 start_codon:yes stop_codon:yes gene_type:complete